MQDVHQLNLSGGTTRRPLPRRAGLCRDLPLLREGNLVDYPAWCLDGVSVHEERHCAHLKHRYQVRIAISIFPHAYEDLTGHVRETQPQWLSRMLETHRNASVSGRSLLHLRVSMSLEHSGKPL